MYYYFVRIVVINIYVFFKKFFQYNNIHHTKTIVNIHNHRNTYKIYKIYKKITYSICILKYKVFLQIYTIILSYIL